jgi:hypothetical protein
MFQTGSKSLSEQPLMFRKNSIGDVLHQCLTSELSTKNIADCQFMETFRKCNSVVAKMTKEYEDYIFNIFQIK